MEIIKLLINLSIFLILLSKIIRTIEEGNSNIKNNLIFLYRSSLRQQQINITYSTDIRTYLFLIVSITSIMEHSTKKNLFYKIYVLIGPGFNNTARNRIENLTLKYQYLSVETITVNYSIPNLKLFKNSPSSSYRLFAPKIFLEIKKIIHLDCDTLIFKDLDYFYNLNMTNLEFRGNLDFDLYGELPRYGIHNDHYINSGVLLMNLDEMRKNKFLEKAINFSKKFGNRLMYPDQAIINSVSIDYCDLLPPEIGFFNLFSSDTEYKKYFRSNFIKNRFTEDDIHKAIHNLTISHLIFKPWADRKNIFSKEWGEMALKTDYVDDIIKLCPWLINLK